jgi:large subunit ribosomal protein L7/L12
MSEEKKVSSAVLGVMDSVAKLNPEEKAQLGLEIIKNLTVMELSKWVKTLEEEFGVSAAPGAAAGAAPAEEKTEFQVVLASSGTNKIQVIKEVRALTNLGLKEAKDLVDGAPKVLKESVSKKEADEIKAKLEAAGAKIEIK